MLKVKIISIGKNKEKWLIEAINEYEKRLSSAIQFEWIFLKNNLSLSDYTEKMPFIALDPMGKEFESISFSKQIFKMFEENHSRLNFVIGSSDGIPKEILKKSFFKISLSKLTFTHQITRLILIEQIYRAYQIQHGSKSYQK
ncbi:MAG: 50S rRNA methyltransferase [Chlamydiae bacterium CG10_big_fil_rev_8_21_14_0_10_35_9]|nr:MAG: 50S rRNA methyltransferase [Chlamydiae bacterium CG10_big_fil_rev_8_21_14_0_10_35_9]